MMNDLKDRVRRVLIDDVAPALQLDAAGIEVCDIQDGVVQVRLGGICSGCPSSIMSVIFGIEQELRQRVPEVAYLEVLPATE